MTMKARNKMRLAAGLMAASIVVTACGNRAPDDNDQQPPSYDKVNTIKDIANTDTTEKALVDFGIRLLSASAVPGENALLSPLSVAAALGMTMNGAGGETLAEMTEVLGIEPEALSQWFSEQRGDWENDRALLLANALWVNEDMGYAPDPAFLDVNEDSYGAEIFSEPFTGKTFGRINDWVEEHTDGLIPKILDEPQPDDKIETAMYLVNALSFEGEWPEPYEEHQVRDDIFTTASGEKRTAEFLYSSEDMYLETENATGFLKPYRGERYAFGALLPNAGTSLEELVQSLDGNSLNALFSKPIKENTNTAIPKFETEFRTELRDILSAMGMPLAFNEDLADFSGIAGQEHPLYVSRVLHKTYLSLGEQGTRAGAATAVEIKEESCSEPSEQSHEIILDRPFLYFIVDLETGTPVFLGTMNDPA